MLGGRPLGIRLEQPAPHHDERRKRVRRQRLRDRLELGAGRTLSLDRVEGLFAIVRGEDHVVFVAMTARKTRDVTWLETWLDSVRSGASTKSQRKLARLETVEGGLAAVRRLAKKKGVHLLLLTDDKGVELIAASTRAFKVIC